MFVVCWVCLGWDVVIFFFIGCFWCFWVVLLAGCRIGGRGWLVGCFWVGCWRIVFWVVLKILLGMNRSWFIYVCVLVLLFVLGWRNVCLIVLWFCVVFGWRVWSWCCRWRSCDSGWWSRWWSCYSYVCLGCLALLFWCGWELVRFLVWWCGDRFCWYCVFVVWWCLGWWFVFYGWSWIRLICWCWWLCLFCFVCRVLFCVSDGGWFVWSLCVLVWYLVLVVWWWCIWWIWCYWCLVDWWV